LEATVSLAFWRDLAIVWLALLCLIGMAVPLVVAFFAVKGMGILLGRAPALLGKVHQVTQHVRTQTDIGSRQVVTRIEDAEQRISTITNAAQRLTTRRAAGLREVGGTDVVQN
jgi:hypothetical protein